MRALSLNCSVRHCQGDIVARPDGLKRGQCFGGKGDHNTQPVGRQFQDRDFPVTEILLITEVFVGGNQHRKTSGLGRIQQLPIGELLPSFVARRSHDVAVKQVFERIWHTVIEQNSLHTAGAKELRQAYSSTATADSRRTPGKAFRNSSRPTPSSRFVRRASIGTRVPRKHSAPPSRSESLQTCGSSSGSNFIPFILSAV
jgi:hypothetical protein